MKNLIKKMALIAISLLAINSVKSQTFDCIVNNTKLCGSTITGEVFDGNNMSLGTFTCNPGSSNVLCDVAYIGGSAPARVDFTEGGTCFLSIGVNTFPAIDCNSAGGTCGCTCMISGTGTPNFSSSYTTGSSCPGPPTANFKLTINIQ
jgi:hypothetical protein